MGQPLQLPKESGKPALNDVQKTGLMAGFLVLLLVGHAGLDPAGVPAAARVTPLLTETPHLLTELYTQKNRLDGRFSCFTFGRACRIGSGRRSGCGSSHPTFDRAAPPLNRTIHTRKPA